MKDNPYLKSIERNLPRLLSLFDTDKTSKTYGIGDRYHWAWNLIDFANGTYQGAAHGFARLIHDNTLPLNISKGHLINIIDSIFYGTKNIIRSNGSLEEAFPYEGSFCVTALVAYDLLKAIELLEKNITISKYDEYIDIIRPMIGFINTHDENHAFISNHLATAAAALIKWEKLTGEKKNSGLEYLNRILSHQSDEGWYKEYDGADPGYQTLCTYYLSDIYEMNNSNNLKESLKKSFSFIKYFVHPDGSFGGTYGSRNTRFFYPSGYEYMSDISNDAASIAIFMRDHIDKNNVVNLDAIDESNFVPMFNSYCWAASIFSKRNRKLESNLPCHDSNNFKKHFVEAGLFVNKNYDDYLVVSINKGGIYYRFNQNRLVEKNDGVLFKNKKGNYISSQDYNSNNKYIINADNIEIEADLKPFSKMQFSPTKMLLMRFLNVTIMRNYFIREAIKKALVKLLITRTFKSSGKLLRRINFNNAKSLEDKIQTRHKLKKIDIQEFISIHMASKGYWQRQDTSEK